MSQPTPDYYLIAVIDDCIETLMRVSDELMERAHAAQPPAPDAAPQPLPPSVTIVAPAASADRSVAGVYRRAQARVGVLVRGMVRGKTDRRS